MVSSLELAEPQDDLAEEPSEGWSLSYCTSADVSVPHFEYNPEGEPDHDAPVIPPTRIERILTDLKAKWDYTPTSRLSFSHRCVEDAPYGKHVCRSAYCAKHCHRWEADQLRKLIDADDAKVKTRLILPIGAVIPPKVLSQLWENWTKRLRRRFPGCEWGAVVELAGENLHLHVVLLTDDGVTFADIDPIWRSCLKKKGIDEPGQNTVRVGAVYDLPGLATYSVKRFQARPWECRPPKGLYHRLAFFSKKYMHQEQESEHQEPAVRLGTGTAPPNAISASPRCGTEVGMARDDDNQHTTGRSSSFLSSSRCCVPVKIKDDDKMDDVNVMVEELGCSGDYFRITWNGTPYMTWEVTDAELNTLTKLVEHAEQSGRGVRGKSKPLAKWVGGVKAEANSGGMYFEAGGLRMMVSGTGDLRAMLAELRLKGKPSRSQLAENVPEVEAHPQPKYRPVPVAKRPVPEVEPHPQPRARCSN